MGLSDPTEFALTGHSNLDNQATASAGAKTRRESDGPVNHTPAHWTVKCPHCGDWLMISNKSWGDAPEPTTPPSGLCVMYGIPM